MPRTTRTQTTTRAGSGESNVNIPADPVSNYAPYVSYYNISADRNAGREDMLVAEALNGFGNSVARVAVDQREADAKRRRLSGQAAALREGPPNDWAAKRKEILADPEKGQEYLSAYSKQGATVAADAKSLTLIDAFTQRTDIDSEAKFNEWYQTETKADLEAIATLDDSEATIAYAGGLEQTEMQLRNALNKRVAEKVYTETETNFNMVAQTSIEKAVASSASGRDLLNLMGDLRKQGKDLLLESSDINEAVVRAVGELAASEGKPELLNLFDYPHPDAQDPTKSVPGLAFSKEQGAVIDQYRQEATKEHDTKVAEQLKKTTYEAQKRATDLLQEGKTAQLEVFTDLMVEQGVFSPAVGASLYKEMHKVDVKAQRIARNLIHITNGVTEAIPADERKEAVEAYGDRVIEKVKALGTPEAAHEGMKDILTTGASVGEMYPAYKAKIQKLNVVDPEQFTSTIQLAQVMGAVSPSLYYDNVPSDTRVEMDQAMRMMEAGLGADQVMAAMQEFRKPENVQRRKDLAGTPTDQAKRRTQIRNQMSLGSDFSNSEEVTSWVADTALDYMLRTGTDDYGDALDYAEKQHKASFATVRLGDGMDKVAIYKGRFGLPDSIEDQFNWFSKSFTKEMRDSNPDLDSNVNFYLVPDAASRHTGERQFLVRDTLGRTQMTMENGLAVPMRVGQRELERDWRQGLTKEAQQEQARKQVERLKGDARVLRNRKYYGVDGDELRRRYRAIGQPPQGEPDVSPPKPAQSGDPVSELPVNLQEATNLVAKYEGFRSEAYAATKAEGERGIYTIGYGQTEGVRPGHKVTEAEAKASLAAQVQRTGDAVRAAVGPYWDQLNDSQQAVVVSLAYNIDKDVVGQFKRSKALRALQRGDIEEFKHQAFDPQVGFTKQKQKDGTLKVVKGLVNRRQDELKRFNAATYGQAASL